MKNFVSHSQNRFYCYAKIVYFAEKLDWNDAYDEEEDDGDDGEEIGLGDRQELYCLGRRSVGGMSSEDKDYDGEDESD